MNVIEQWIRSKQGADLSSCEDALVVTPDFVAVIDGATSVGDRLYTRQQVTSGQWAAQVLKQGVQSLSSLSVDEDDENDDNASSSPAAIIHHLTKCLAQAYRDEGVYNEMQAQPDLRATASIILYARHLHQIIAVGDCQAVVLLNNDHRQGNQIVRRIQPTKHTDAVMSAARAMVCQMQLLSSSSSFDKKKKKNANDTTISTPADIGREFIQPLLKGQKVFQNNPRAPAPWQYWVLDGFPVCPQRGIHVYNVPTNQAVQIILATDGYLQVHPSLQETERALQTVLQGDPHLIGAETANTKGVRPGAESFDDRTFVRFTVPRKESLSWSCTNSSTTMGILLVFAVGASVASIVALTCGKAMARGRKGA